jgi:hypothetical protein
MSLTPGTSAPVSTATTPSAGAYRIEIERGDPGVRPVGEAEIAVQRAGGFWHVVDVVGSAGDMLVG